MTRRKENKGKRKVAKHLWPAGGDAEHFEASFPWGSGSIPFSLLERCFLIIILTSTIYGPNAKHMHHIVYSLQQPYETGAIFVSILQIRDGAERGQWAELGLVLGTCQTVKPRSLILPFAALPKILSPREIIYTYF